MITDKDREDKNDAYDVALKILSLGNTESTPGNIADIINKHATESADQARKEAAERAEKAWREHGDGITLRILRESILGDYATDQIEGEKLAIAVKALEEIKQIRKAGPAFESHFSKLQDIGRITNDALKEIQG